MRGIGERMEGLEMRQEEIVKLLNSLRLLKKLVFVFQIKAGGIFLLFYNSRAKILKK